MALGDVVYVDYFDHKAPGIYWLSAIMYMLFGPKLMPVRVLMVIINLVNAVLLYRLVNARATENISLVAGLGYLVLSVWYQGSYFMTESFVSFLLLLFFWLFDSLVYI